MAMAATASHLTPRTPAGFAAQDLTTRGMIVLAVVAMAAITGLDLIDSSIGFIFSLGFTLIVLTTALAVNVRKLFPAGVMPPLLLLGMLLLLCIAWPSSVAVDGTPDSAGLFTRYLATVIDHGATLFIGHGLAIAAIIWRVLKDA